MSDEELHAIVAEFLHVLSTSPDALKQWQNTRKHPKEMAALMQETLKLSAAPSESDMRKMTAFADAQLSQHVASLNKVSGGPPQQVGSSFGMTQDDRP
jgi:hypothetical protein